MKVSKTLALIVSSTLLFAACGNSGDKTKSGETTPATAQAPAESSKGLELIGVNDCTTCHRLQKDGSGPNTGPSYSEVADKYAPAADTTVDRLVKKIVNGGNGVWGQAFMTPHTNVPEADVKEMVKYILSLKK